MLETLSQKEIISLNTWKKVKNIVISPGVKKYDVIPSQIIRSPAVMGEQRLETSIMINIQKKPIYRENLIPLLPGLPVRHEPEESMLCQCERWIGYCVNVLWRHAPHAPHGPGLLESFLYFLVLSHAKECFLTISIVTVHLRSTPLPSTQEPGYLNRSQDPDPCPHTITVLLSLPLYLE